MDALSKCEKWVACTIITNAAQREHSRGGSQGIAALRTPDSSAGLNINAIPAAKCITSVLTGLNVVATSGFNAPNTADRRPNGSRFQLIVWTIVGSYLLGTFGNSESLALESCLAGSFPIQRPQTDMAGYWKGVRFGVRPIHCR